jgi:hypothetical protein
MDLVKAFEIAVETTQKEGSQTGMGSEDPTIGSAVPLSAKRGQMTNSYGA